MARHYITPIPGTAASVHFHWVPDPDVLANDYMWLSDYLDDPTRFLEQAQELLRLDTEERFTTKTDPEGEPWEPWAKSYELYASRRNINGILEQDGDLRREVGGGLAYVVSGNAIFIDTSAAMVSWGMAHQEGAVRSKRGESGGYRRESGAALAEAKQMIIRQHRAGQTFRDPKAAARGIERQLIQEATNFLPARPFIGPSATTREAIAGLFEVWVDRGIREWVASPAPVMGTTRVTSRGRRYFQPRDAMGRFVRGGRFLD